MARADDGRPCKRQIQPSLSTEPAEVKEREEFKKDKVMKSITYKRENEGAGRKYI